MRIILSGLFTFIIGLSATSQTLDFAFPFRNDHRPENQALSSVYPAKSYGSVQDNEGNQYVYGTIKDTTDINPGSDSLFLLQPYPSLFFGLCGFPKAYIVKYSPSNEVVWVRTLIGYSELGQIVIDHNNDLIVTGSWSYGLYTEFGGNETPVFTNDYDKSKEYAKANGVLDKMLVLYPTPGEENKFATEQKAMIQKAMANPPKSPKPSSGNKPTGVIRQQKITDKA
jgi:hypothetical protein